MDQLWNVTLNGHTLAVHTSEADAAAAVESYHRAGFRGLDVVTDEVWPDAYDSSEAWAEDVDSVDAAAGMQL